MAPFLPDLLPYHADLIILPNPCGTRLVPVVFCGFTFKEHGWLVVEAWTGCHDSLLEKLAVRRDRT